ncbi:MAG: Arc family DNA-binding protein [Mesorhizobium sp.]|nr:MAG: Arc family DNA-binding protein [Mesorhizobium sp.]
MLGLFLSAWLSRISRGMPKPVDEFHIRVSPELYKRVRHAQVESGRSLNAELVAIIERGLDARGENLEKGLKLIRDGLDLIEKGGA